MRYIKIFLLNKTTTDFSKLHTKYFYQFITKDKYILYCYKNHVSKFFSKQFETFISDDVIINLQYNFKIVNNIFSLLFNEEFDFKHFSLDEIVHFMLAWDDIIAPNNINILKLAIDNILKYWYHKWYFLLNTTYYFDTETFKIFKDYILYIYKTDYSYKYFSKLPNEIIKYNNFHKEIIKDLVNVSINNSYFFIAKL